jgi:hypothetical protein
MALIMSQKCDHFLPASCRSRRRGPTVGPRALSAGHATRDRRRAERTVRDVTVGSRTGDEDWGAYTVEDAALRHGAGVESETTSPAEAYARFPEGRFTRYREGWLPR